MKTVLLKLRQAWCRLMHPAPMWPVHGLYTCPRCGLTNAVPWEERGYQTDLPHKP